MKKILIDENKAKAQQTLAAFEAKADRMTACISEYNQSGLEPLIQKTAPEFLKDPKGYLDSQLIQESGLKMKNIQPDKIADLMGINYRKILSFISDWNVQDYTIDESLIVRLSAEKREQIIEDSKFYLSDERDILAYRNLQKLCEMLNTHAKASRIDNFDINHTAQFLRLETVKNEVGKYEYVPSIRNLRQMLSA